MSNYPRRDAIPLRRDDFERSYGVDAGRLRAAQERLPLFGDGRVQQFSLADADRRATGGNRADGARRFGRAGAFPGIFARGFVRRTRYAARTSRSAPPQRRRRRTSVRLPERRVRTASRRGVNETLFGINRQKITRTAAPQRRRPTANRPKREPPAQPQTGPTANRPKREPPPNRKPAQPRTAPQSRLGEPASANGTETALARPRGPGAARLPANLAIRRLFLFNRRWTSKSSANGAKKPSSRGSSGPEQRGRRLRRTGA